MLSWKQVLPGPSSAKRTFTERKWKNSATEQLRHDRTPTAFAADNVRTEFLIHPMMFDAHMIERVKIILQCRSNRNNIQKQHPLENSGQMNSKTKQDWF